MAAILYSAVETCIHVSVASRAFSFPLFSVMWSVNDEWGMALPLLEMFLASGPQSMGQGFLEIAGTYVGLSDKRGWGRCWGRVSPSSSPAPWLTLVGLPMTHLGGNRTELREGRQPRQTRRKRRPANAVAFRAARWHDAGAQRRSPPAPSPPLWPG